MLNCCTSSFRVSGNCFSRSVSFFPPSFRFFGRGGRGGGGGVAEFSDSSANFCEAFFFFVELGVNYAVLTILQHARSVWLGNVV